MEKIKSGFWYLATPYTNYPDGMESAYFEAVKAQAEFLRRGLLVFCPVAHTHHAGEAIGDTSHDFWVNGVDFPFLEASVGVIVVPMPGWDSSEGIRREIERANELGKPVEFCSWPGLNFADGGAVPVAAKENSADPAEKYPDESLTQTTGPLGYTERFDAALATLTQDRGAEYGHPADDFDRVARIKAILADFEDPLLRHVLEMIAVKMARILHSPEHFDSWADIAGYARTACMVIDRRAAGPIEDSGWIEWDGENAEADEVYYNGPFADIDTPVDVKFRHAEIDISGNRARHYYWGHDGCESDIIAYRRSRKSA